MSGTTEQEAPRFVMVADKQACYPEPAFVREFNNAFLAYLAAAIPQGATARKAARAVREMKKETRHEAVLRAALVSLGNESSLSVEDVHRDGGVIVATFAV